MDKVQQTFDKWAQNGRAELMEIEHGKNVSKFLDSISFEKPFSFLDVGCGNGWVVRMISKMENCKKAMGIDKSKEMIIQAKRKTSHKKQSFVHADIEFWKYNGKFDYIFSMESLYYANSLSLTLGKIFKLLKPGGQFFCGTDFYSDNKTTTRWTRVMKIHMHLHSKKEWKNFFNESGFDVTARHVKDLKSKKKWKRDWGTLFLTGTKPSANCRDVGSC